jgi:hypothetical protein
VQGFRCNRTAQGHNRLGNQGIQNHIGLIESQIDSIRGDTACLGVFAGHFKPDFAGIRGGSHWKYE